MRIRLFRPCFFCMAALCILTVGVNSAHADTISLSNGSVVSGGTVLVLNIFGFAQVTTAVPWSMTGSGLASWTNSSILSINGFVDDGVGAVGQFTGMSLLTGPLDFNGDGTQYHLNLEISGTGAQFGALLGSLAFGQTTQVPLLAGNGCGGPCTSVIVDKVFNNTLVGQQTFQMVGPGFLTITNDPGLYDVTITSTPLGTGVPEPATLLLTGAGMAGLTWRRRRSAAFS